MSQNTSRQENKVNAALTQRSCAEMMVGNCVTSADTFSRIEKLQKVFSEKGLERR